ncbi:MAG: alpha-ketoglutarate-dependent dioxygenase AlkB [Synechococcaceae cyanobacterium]|nr:alpha-ketoglutarate-dependent dioxygenase AlkB [Synechococcaceae cyanobacterium]
MPLLAPLQMSFTTELMPPPQGLVPFQADGLRVRLWRGWLAEPSSWFELLRDSITWHQPSVSLYGRSHSIPRLSGWVADPGCSYAYSGLEQAPQPWTPPLTRLRRQIEAQLELAPGQGFHGVLLNLYRDGRDAMGWHADDEPELDPEASIASLSLGACRSFRLRPRAGGGQPLALELAHGDLLVMDPPTQRFWLHSLPRRLRLREPRLSLTFRRLRSGRE